MRLITRGDLDGLTSAVILTLAEPIDEIMLVHPQDITDKQVEVRGDDVLANVPYDPRCGMWFDHHLLTDSNEKPPTEFQGATVWRRRRRGWCTTSTWRSAPATSACCGWPGSWRRPTGWMRPSSLPTTSRIRAITSSSATPSTHARVWATSRTTSSASWSG